MADKESGRSNRVTPFDWAKTFVGPNATYYDERWRWMEWRDKHQSWNWAAALSFGVWFAYRRLYGWAVLFFGWLMALLAMALIGVNLHLLAAAQVLVAVIAGGYANALYRQRFRHMAVEVARNRNEHAERLAALRRVGGIDLPAARLMVLAMVAGAIMMIWRNRNSVGVQW